MAILKFHQGCYNMKGCWGPKEDYYTLFGTELRFLLTPALISLTIGAITFGVLYFLKKKEIVHLPPSLIIIISFIMAIVSLRLLAPMTQVLY